MTTTKNPEDKRLQDLNKLQYIKIHKNHNRNKGKTRNSKCAKKGAEYLGIQHLHVRQKRYIQTSEGLFLASVGIPLVTKSE
jgi:hypothetical protein